MAQTGSEDSKQKSANSICISGFFSICQHASVVQTEPRLFLELCKGDQALAARMLGNTSGLVGILSLLVNQAGGKISDSIGRKPCFLVGPLANTLLGLLVFKNSNNLFLVMICRVLRFIFTTFSSSVMAQAALTDVCKGKALEAANAKLSYCFGLGMLCTPFLEARLLQRGNKYVYLALSGIGLAHTAFILACMKETLPPSSRQGAVGGEGQRRILEWNTVNPFGFINVFTKGTTELWKSTVITAFQFFLEGKNISDLAQVWVRDYLKWSVEGVRNFVVIYGLLCTLSGMFVTPRLLHSLSKRRFTTVTNSLNLLGFLIRGLKANTGLWLMAMVPMLPGVNAASTFALKAYASQLALEQGFGNGEFSAWVNNLRALVGSAAPMLYGQLYAAFQKAGMNPGLTFAIAGLIGAATPELLMRSLQDPELDICPKMKVAAGSAAAART